MDGAPAAPVAGIHNVFDILQKCLLIPLPDNEEVVEDPIASCTQQVPMESTPVPVTASAPPTTPSATNSAAVSAGPAQGSPTLEVKKKAFVMPIFPERGVIMTTAQVEAFVRADIAAGTNWNIAPLRMPPPPALPCIIPVAGGIQFPVRPVDPNAGQKILQSLLAGPASSAVDAPAASPPAAAKPEAAFKFSVTAAEYIPHRKGSVCCSWSLRALQGHGA